MNCIAYGELGKINLKHVIQEKTLNFWHRIITGKSSKISATLYNLLKCLHDKNVYSSPWITNMNSILNSLGMSHLWHVGDVYPRTWLKGAVKHKIRDINLQN